MPPRSSGIVGAYLYSYHFSASKPEQRRPPTISLLNTIKYDDASLLLVHFPIRLLLLLHNPRGKRARSLGSPGHDR